MLTVVGRMDSTRKASRMTGPRAPMLASGVHTAYVRRGMRTIENSWIAAWLRTRAAAAASLPVGMLMPEMRKIPKGAPHETARERNSLFPPNAGAAAAAPIALMTPTKKYCRSTN
eukprot:scaffold158447_cov34-Tisochrysis_lutea.AAC.1